MGGPSPLMTNSEILAVSKILLESRAFTKEEMSGILNKLVAGCVPLENIKLVSALVSNELFHYVELTHPVGIQDKLWEIGCDIQQHHLMRIRYQRQGADAASAVERIVEPVSILFSEYYFYLNAYITKENDGKYTRKYDYPAIFRIDRIADYKIMEQTFSLPYASRFQEGEFRKRVQFMYPGGCKASGCATRAAAWKLSLTACPRQNRLTGCKWVSCRGRDLRQRHRDVAAQSRESSRGACTADSTGRDVPCADGHAGTIPALKQGNPLFTQQQQHWFAGRRQKAKMTKLSFQVNRIIQAK